MIPIGPARNHARAAATAATGLALRGEAGTNEVSIQVKRVILYGFLILLHSGYGSGTSRAGTHSEFEALPCPQSAFFEGLPSPHVLRSLAESNAMALLRMGIDGCSDRFDAYSCRLVRQERIDGVLRPEQEFEVLFQERPFSVDLRWVRGPRDARRVSYEESDRGARLTGIARVEVPGIPFDLRLDIHGSLMHRYNRRPLDQFGFCRILRGIVEVCDAWRDADGYSLRVVGRDNVDGRPCFLYERRLPVRGDDGAVPAALLRLWIDEQWLVPLRCEEYGDREATLLLGRYEFLRVRRLPSPKGVPKRPEKPQ